MFDAFARLLAFFYDVWPSYAVAIIGLTVAVRLVLFPLTAKQARSMQAMQRVQPELKRLQAKYKDDRQKLNEEMMKFYRENKINPLASCLPLLLQLPLFLVLYRVINGLTHTVLVGAVVVGGTGVGGQIDGVERVRLQNEELSGGSIVDGRLDGAKLSGDAVVNGRVVGRISGARVENGRVVSAAVVRESAEVGRVTDIRIEGNPQLRGDPSYLPESSALYKALAEAGGRMESLGMDLARSASRASGDGLGELFPYAVLVALTVATGYYQQRQMTRRTPAASQNPQMQMMGKIFPVMFGVISWSIAAGVVLYFVVSNIWQIGQQAMIFRHVVRPDEGDKGPGAADGGTPEKSGKPVKGGPDKGGPAKRGADKRGPDKPVPDKRVKADGKAKPAASGTGKKAAGTGKPSPRRSPRAERPGDGRAGRATPQGTRPRGGSKRTRRKGS